MSTKSPVEKRLTICDDEFQIMNTSHFESLPNEILMKIFDYIRVEDLIRCGQVSRRIRTVAHDHSLWPKINPRPKTKVTAELIFLLIGLFIIGILGYLLFFGLLFFRNIFPRWSNP